MQDVDCLRESHRIHRPICVSIVVLDCPYNAGAAEPLHRPRVLTLVAHPRHLERVPKLLHKLGKTLQVRLAAPNPETKYRSPKYTADFSELLRGVDTPPVSVKSARIQSLGCQNCLAKYRPSFPPPREPSNPEAVGVPAPEDTHP